MTEGKTSRSGDRLAAMAGGPTTYESVVWFEAESRAGVRCGIARISFGRRIDLARRIREVGRRAEFLDASGEAKDRIEAAVVKAEIDRAYLDWGWVGVEGLEIDGAAATPGSAIEAGPAELAAEVLARIKSECGLTDDERKN
ncbi:MAG: hypothetical protein LAO79_13575 [Acidobacteriia bacterium]|nr:hypothetical protein [Terriglobia bacterium]